MVALAKTFGFSSPGPPQCDEDEADAAERHANEQAAIDLLVAAIEGGASEVLGVISACPGIHNPAWWAPF